MPKGGRHRLLRARQQPRSRLGRGRPARNLVTIDALGIKTAGAGRDLPAASRPAILEIAGKGRVIVHAFGHPTERRSPQLGGTAEGARGQPATRFFRREASRSFAGKWETSGGRAMWSLFRCIGAGIGDTKSRGTEIRFAHRLIEEAGVSVVYGHSSHHAKAIEIYRDRLILYGCGDFFERLRRDCRARRIPRRSCADVFASVHAQTGGLSPGWI